MDTIRTTGARTCQAVKHTLTQAHRKWNLSSVQVAINGPSGWELTSIEIRMASPEPSIHPPLLSYCLLQAKFSCLRIATRRCFWHLCCIDLGNGHHFSHSKLFPVSPTQEPYFHNQSPLPTAYPANFLFDLMGMVRHWMTSRHGGTRGGISCPQAA